MKIVLLNGPPRVGKDVIGSMLCRHTPVTRLQKFAAPIVDFMYRQFGVEMATVDKDMPNPRLFGRTPREVAICFSEKLMKPLFGQDFFGREAVNQLNFGMRSENGDLAVFTDSGFAGEAGSLVEAFGKGSVLQVRLSRPGCSFLMDSRSYWSHPDIGSIEFVNDTQTLEDLEKQVETRLVPQILEFVRT